jgi:hypothetical protein
MAHLVTFRTAKFDPKAEPANPINPIAGHAVLMWLRDALRDAGFESGEPDSEDWGWYLDVSGHGATYLVGASGDAEPGDKGPIDWTVQIHRHRSFTDKLFSRNAHAADDALTAFIERVVRASPDLKNVEVDRAG